MSDLSTNPDYVYEEGVTFNTLVSEFENGTEQRRPRWSSDLRKFRLVYKNRPSSDFSTIKSLFETKKGRYTAFTWTNPNDSVEYTVRFDSDEITFENVTYGIYNFEFTLKEVR